MKTILTFEIYKSNGNKYFLIFLGLLATYSVFYSRPNNTPWTSERFIF